MIKIHRSDERGLTDEEWLHSFHTFSFGGYHDSQMMGFRTLRVINDDRVSAGEGFGMHPHRDMEIITIVLEGALAHKDSMGNSSVIRPGEIQRMSAGTGVRHSEFNHSRKDPVHLYQIWILPLQKGLTPSYEQKAFPARDKKNNLRLVASQNGEEDSVTIHQDVAIYDCELDNKKEVASPLKKGRGAWVQVKTGQLKINGSLLQGGDAAAIEPQNESPLRFRAQKDSGFLLFDLA